MRFLSTLPVEPFQNILHGEIVDDLGMRIASKNVEDVVTDPQDFHM